MNKATNKKTNHALKKTISLPINAGTIKKSKKKNNNCYNFIKIEGC